MKKLMTSLEQLSHVKKIDANTIEFHKPLIELTVRLRASELGFAVITRSANSEVMGEVVAQPGLNLFPAGKTGRPAIVLKHNREKLGWQIPRFDIVPGEKPLTPELRRKIVLFFKALGR